MLTGLLNVLFSDPQRHGALWLCPHCPVPLPEFPIAWMQPQIEETSVITESPNNFEGPQLRSRLHCARNGINMYLQTVPALKGLQSKQERQIKGGRENKCGVTGAAAGTAALGGSKEQDPFWRVLGQRVSYWAVPLLIFLWKMTLQPPGQREPRGQRS